MPKAGHFVPANYYLPSYQFFQDYIAGQKLACHGKDGNCSTVEAKCTAMNNCHTPNGTCN